MTVLKAGEAAPEFNLPTQDGVRLSLADLRGKWVVLYFYPKDNTPGCTVEARNFQASLPEFEKAGAVILGVSFDSPASHQRFCSKQGLTFRLLADTNKEVAARYGSVRNFLGFKIAARNTYLIDPRGRIAHVWTAVDPSTHSREVLAAIHA